MKSSVYKIGKVYIEICKPENMKTPKNLELFRVEESLYAEKVQMTYSIEYVEDIERLEQDFERRKVAGKSAVRNNLLVYQVAEGECRVIRATGIKSAYAVTLTMPNGWCNVWVDQAYDSWMELDVVFVSLLALEKQMVDTGALILHSAYMCYEEMAVLFSAPSETGKSTQARLWEQYRGTSTINGDKSLLIRENDGWKAYGWPICGTSGICYNESYPIRAIVMLKQAKKNQAYPLKGLQAVREIMEQITINAWDSTFQMKVMDLLECLVQEIPVYRLECDISEEAVKCLENVI